MGSNPRQSDHHPRRPDSRPSAILRGMPVADQHESRDDSIAQRLCNQKLNLRKSLLPFVPEISALARFQPIGIMQSKCYQSSDGALSCVNCHDPHARTSSDPRASESACLKCHGNEAQVRCRVSPKSDWLSCHMPLVDTGQRVLFTDHWIRVRHVSDPPTVPRIGQAGGGSIGR